MPKFTVRATYVAEVEIEVEAKNKEEVYEKVDALNLDQWEIIGWDNFMIEEIEEANHGRD